jgi:ATP-binding protein involved in chromosome partitioning
MADVRKATNMFLQVQVPVLGVVENMSYFLCPTCSERHEIFGHGGGPALAEKYQVPFLGEVPLGLGVREGGDAGTPVAASEPDSPPGQAFREIARRVVEQLDLNDTPLPTIGVK